MIGGYNYELLELPQDRLASFLKKREFDGINVTIPYKESVLPYLDEIDPSAAKVGAVNTIVNRHGKLYGYNTDLGGMIAQIRQMGLELCGKKVLILGTGGAAKTAYAAASQLGAAEVSFVSRSGRNGSLTYDEASLQCADVGILINATPCGMYPELDNRPIDLTHFPFLSGVLDAIYNPLSSRLVLDARQRGIPAQGGLYMLVTQAALASELFTGKRCEQNTVDAVYSHLLREKRNLILIGMPGCGKTSVGQEAARRMGRSFIDLDDCIAAKAGKTIPDIFSEDGETVFRDMESQLVRDIAIETGLVIATGGGCVMRPENMERLRQNGCLFLLDRPIEQLLPTADRPLSDSFEKLRALHHQRQKLYRDAADEVIPTENSVASTAQAVVRRFNEVLYP